MSLKGVSVPRTFLFLPLLPGYGEVSSSVSPTLPQAQSSEDGVGASETVSQKQSFSPKWLPRMLCFSNRW